MNNSPDLLTRRLAVEIFDAVLRRDRGLEDEYAARMEKQDGIRPLEPRDRNFVRLLATVMLRRLGQIDDIIGRFLKTPLPDKACFVSDALRVTTAQLVFLDTPAHAAVSTGVDLVKSNRDYAGFAALVNAVSRRIAEQGKQIADGQDAAKMNVPDWMYREWQKEYGAENARKIAAAGLREAPLDFSVRDNAAVWARRLGAVEMPTGTLRRQDQASVPSLDGFDDGAWWVQDLSAAMPAALFHNPSGKKAVDLCAAPGGKTAQLAAMGADVTAVDVSANRIKRLRENMRRLNLDVTIVCADVRKWWQETVRPQKLQFDAVLLDAPCSATGTLRRHPDVACHRTPQDVERLNKTQAELLETAASMLADDGELVYCVCSILPSEGRKIIDAAVKRGVVERVPLTVGEVPAEMITESGDLCILPFFYESSGGCDGFFAARLKKGKMK